MEDATIHLKIPDLSWVGEKLRQPWMERLVGGDLPYKTRPRLPVRMPAFPAFASGLATGLAQQHGISVSAGAEAGPASPMVRLGRDLTGPQQLACTQCHPVAGRAALAGADTETIDLQHMGHRLRKEFFERLLRDPSRVIPGTMMPSFLDEQGRSTLQGVLDGDGQGQSRALWEYIRSLP